MIPTKETLNFFAKGNFAFDKELRFANGGSGALFHRAPARFTGKLVQLFKEKNPLEKSDANFLGTSWAPLTLSACRGIYTTLHNSLGAKLLPIGRLEEALSMINHMGWGKVQIVESRPGRSVLRLFHSYEDKLYVESKGKAPYPISAFCAGMLLGAHIYSLSFETNSENPAPLEYEALKGAINTFDQERCEAEGQPYGEFVILSKS